MTTESVAPPPAGFVQSTLRGPFTTHNGPVYHRPDDPHVRAFRVLLRHCNGFGIAHGGWLMAFTDGVLGSAVYEGTKSRSVTLRMNTDFVDMVRQGEWVEILSGLAKGDTVVLEPAGLRTGQPLMLDAKAR